MTGPRNRETPRNVEDWNRELEAAWSERYDELERHKRTLDRALDAEARCVRAEEALRQIIDCPDFSAKRAFSMKMIARAALAVVPEENKP